MLAVNVNDDDDLPAVSCFTGAALSQWRYSYLTLYFSPFLDFISAVFVRTLIIGIKCFEPKLTALQRL